MKKFLHTQESPLLLVEIYTGSMVLVEDEDMEEEVPEEDPAMEIEKDEEVFDGNAGAFPSEELKMEVDQEALSVKRDR